MYKKINVCFSIVFVFMFSACGEKKTEVSETIQNGSGVVLNEGKTADQELTTKNSDSQELTDQKAMTPQQIAKADDIIASVSEKDMEKIDAARLYKMHCASCHGFKGNMNINGAKDLTLSKLPLNERVAQTYFGKGLMMPYQNSLKDYEIVVVSQYIETLRN